MLGGPLERSGFLPPSSASNRRAVVYSCSAVLTGHSAEIELHAEMPTGPLNRVADNSLARNLLAWEPEVKFVDGLHRTADWYFASKEREMVSVTLEQRLTER